MKYFVPTIIGGLLLLLAGCETRSISNSDYRSPWGRGGSEMYKGELTELDVLGLTAKQDASEENIQKALATVQALHLKRGDRILLIQSGAMVPDGAMLEEAGRYFELAPFSGEPSADKAGLSASLRLRAAQGGYPYLLCYWGVLESARQDREGAAVSWVPIVGPFIPDQKQRMRIRLKALLVDVQTGAWKMYMPDSYADAKWSSGLSREKTDQRLVEELKRSGYKALVSDLVK